MSGQGADFLSLSAAELPARGMAAALAQHIRDAVVDGRLGVGVALPATRALAEDLGISRGVVVESYRRLTDEGLLRSRRGAGTEVADLISVTATREPGQVLPTAHPALDLSPGVPDLSAFPRSAWLRAERAVLNDSDIRTLGYSDPQGHPVLRAELARWLARHRGVRVGPGDIVVTAGVAQALAIMARTLQARGITRMGMEDPGSRGVRDHLSDWGQTVQPIAVDEHGLDVAELAATEVRVVVTTPAHQFPTGVVLAPQRRRELTAWADAGGLVIEDDYDAEHRYDRAPVPALHPSAPHAIAYTGSVSKTLAPGLRLGWLVPPGPLLADVVAAKHSFDISMPSLAQLVLARLMADGSVDRHLRSVRIRQRRRRDALLAALAHEVPGTQVHGVAAGLHLLVTIAGVSDDVRLARVLARAGVVAHPLSHHRLRPGPGGLILGYAAHSVEQLTEAAARLGAAVAAWDETADARAASTSSRQATRQPTVRT